MKWFRRVFIGLVVLLIILAVVAFLLPAGTKHTRVIELHQTPEAIFAVLSDVQKMPDWNSNVTKVEVLPPIDGKEATRQTFKQGMVMTIVTSESLAPTHLVREMRDSSAPFSGSWNYEITPTSEGSKVALTENSEVKNPFFRLMVLIFGPTKYLDEHLSNLGRKLENRSKFAARRRFDVGVIGCSSDDNSLVALFPNSRE